MYQAVAVSDFKDYKAKFAPRIKSASDMLTVLLERRRMSQQDIEGKPHGSWTLFNKTFGGARGETTVLTGNTSSGKTTFARNWLLDNARQGRPSLLVSLEDPITKVIDILAKMQTGRRTVRDLTDDDIKTIAANYETWPLYYLDYNGMMPATLIYKMIDYVVLELGIKFILIDHIDYISKQWNSRNESYVIGDAMRTIVGRSHQHDCTILLISHPSKRGDKRINLSEVGMDELKGSSSIAQEADNVFGIHRPDPQEASMYLRFHKIRSDLFSGNMKSKISFKFDPSRLELTESSMFLEWGE